MRQSLTRNKIITLSCIAVITLALTMLLPVTEALTSDIKAFLIITAIGIMMIATNLFDSIMLPSFFLMFGYAAVCGIGTVMSGWANDTPWSIIFIFVILSVLKRTSLLKRFSYKCILLTGCSYAGICTGLFLVGLPLAVLGSSSCCALLAMAYAIVSAVDMPKKARAGIMMCAYFGITDAGCFVLNPAMGPFLFGQASGVCELVPASTSYAEWFQAGIIFIPYYIVLLVCIILTFRPKEVFGKNSRVFFAAELNNLGPMTGNEKKLLFIILALFVYLFSQPLHSLPMIYGFVGAVILLFLPGIELADKQDVEEANFRLPIFIVACLAIGSVSSKLGVGDLLIDVLLPVLSGHSIHAYFVLVAITCTVVNFAVTPLAIYSALVIPLTTVTMAMPEVHNIYPLILSMFVGVCNMLLPYESANTLLLFSFDVMSLRDFVKGFGIKLVLSTSWLMLAITYWKYIGMLS